MFCILHWGSGSLRDCIWLSWGPLWTGLGKSRAARQQLGSALLLAILQNALLPVPTHIGGELSFSQRQKSPRKMETAAQFRKDGFSINGVGSVVYSYEKI